MPASPNCAPARNGSPIRSWSWRAPTRPDLALLDSLPVAAVDLAQPPDERARALFDAF
jgi:hypothetical protein